MSLFHPLWEQVIKMRRRAETAAHFDVYTQMTPLLHIGTSRQRIA